MNYHWPNDVPEALHWGTIEGAIAVCERVPARARAQRLAGAAVSAGHRVRAQSRATPARRRHSSGTSSSSTSSTAMIPTGRRSASSTGIAIRL